MGKKRSKKKRWNRIMRKDEIQEEYQNDDQRTAPSNENENKEENRLKRIRDESIEGNGKDEKENKKKSKYKF